MQSYQAQYGQKVHDCSGLIKGYIFCDTPNSFMNSKKWTSEVDNNIKYDSCTEKGLIDSLPELPGVLVFMPGHVGVYIGNGQVVEARGHAYGVVQTALKGRGWTKWGKCKFIEYVEEEKMFENGQEIQALDYLVEKGRISDKEHWLKTLAVVKNQNWGIIKWANDVKTLEKNNLA